MYLIKEVILNCNNILLFLLYFDQINVALVDIKDLIEDLPNSNFCMAVCIIKYIACPKKKVTRCNIFLDCLSKSCINFWP